jgi:tetratricopeptide (TPR) repeat protein
MRNQKFAIGIYLILFFCSVACKKSNNDGNIIPPLPNEAEFNIYKASLSVLNDEIQSNSSNHENYFKRAKIFVKLNDFENAKKDINSAIELNKNDGRYRLLNSLILREEGQFKPALEEAKNAEILGLKTPEIFTTIGDLYLKNNQINEASKYLKFALDFAPFNGESYYYNALLKIKKGDTASAIVFYNLAKKYKPKFVNTYKRLSEIYSTQGNTDLAKDITFELAKQYPNDAENCSIIAKIFQRRLNVDSALIFYKKAIKLKPNMFQASYDAGVMSLRNGYYKDALMFFENTQKYAPKTAFIKTNLAMCYENLGEKQKALDLYTIAYSINNYDFKAIEGIKRLEEKPYFYDPNAENYQSEINKDQANKTKIDTTRIRLNEIKPKKVNIQRRDSSLNKGQIPNKLPLPIIK